MSKSILIMDTPKACVDCPCHFADEVKVWCGKEKRDIDADDIEVFKPDWCPLKEMPDKYWPVGMNFERGWNTCIDNILKE